MDIADAGQWIADALAPFRSGARPAADRSTVAASLPDRFEAYARILHPVNREDGTPLTWSEIARKTGRAVHPCAQFAAVAGIAYGDPLVLDGKYLHVPREGELDAAQLAALATILGEHTGTPRDVYLALWDGYGWIHGAGAVSVLWSVDEPETPSAEFQEEQAALLAQVKRLQEPSFPYEVLNGTLLDVGHGFRQYFVFRGTITDLAHPPWAEGRTLNTQTPNLAWPADHAWCLATEIDFDSTLAGGTREAIDAVVRSPLLEALPVTPATSLAWDADTVNPRVP
ncbi:hypothetical protein [Specibacter cremeus]|uniref:hypothetical protein n=1 Tax=Specibacter cremeus TaxID=1629051 RepID=UPI000F7B35A2|nr:hypothetical protein [Specibacter cremeus]